MNATSRISGGEPARLRATGVASAFQPLVPSLERRRLQCYLALILGDLAALTLGCTLVGYVYLGALGAQQGLLFAQLVTPLFLTVGLYNGAYSKLALRMGARGTARALAALGLAIATVMFISYYARANQNLSRTVTALGSVAAAAILVWMRVQMRAVIRWRCGRNVINELVIDDGGPPVHAIGTVRVNAGLLGLSPALDNPHALNRIGQILENIDRVIVSCPPWRRAAWALVLKASNVDGEVVDQNVVDLGALGARVVSSNGLLAVSHGPLGLRHRVMKRTFDIVVSAALLIVLCPLLLVTALAIKLEDGGPVLFIQRRLGRANRFFAIFKFRSMKVARGDADGSVSAAPDDDRITRIGRLMRRTSIDELPQLINVLTGSMSLVGPRPHAIGSQAGDKLFWEVDERYWVRHALRPGMTGLAQVRGWRGATETERDLTGRLQADLEYLTGWSLMRDMRILVATLRVLVHERAF